MSTAAKKVTEVAVEEFHKVRTLIIDKIEEDVNMRYTRAVREEKIVKSLKPGHCIMQLNTKRDMGRVLDHLGSYTLYAPEGFFFDLHALQVAVREGIGVKMVTKDTQIATAIQEDQYNAKVRKSVLQSPKLKLVQKEMFE